MSRLSLHFHIRCSVVLHFIRSSPVLSSHRFRWPAHHSFSIETCVLSHVARLGRQHNSNATLVLASSASRCRDIWRYSTTRRLQGLLSCRAPCPHSSLAIVHISSALRRENVHSHYQPSNCAFRQPSDSATTHDSRSRVDTVVNPGPLSPQRPCPRLRLLHSHSFRL